MNDTTDIIVLEEEYVEEIEATGANLFINIKGSSFWTGEAAFQKAKEVNALVSQLLKAGLTEGDIQLRDVRAEVETGLFTTSSSAQYLLRVHCSAMDKLAEVMTVVNSQKNVVLQGINWIYPDSNDQRVVWIEKCLTRLNSRVESIAKKVGVTVKGIRKLTEKLVGTEVEKTFELQDAAPYMARVRAAAVSAGGLSFSMSHIKKMGVSIYVEYKISERTN